MVGRGRPDCPGVDWTVSWMARAWPLLLLLPPPPSPACLRAGALHLSSSGGCQESNLGKTVSRPVWSASLLGVPGGDIPHPLSNSPGHAESPPPPPATVVWGRVRASQATFLVTMLSAVHTETQPLNLCGQHRLNFRMPFKSLTLPGTQSKPLAKSP